MMYMLSLHSLGWFGGVMSRRIVMPRLSTMLINLTCCPLEYLFCIRFLVHRRVDSGVVHMHEVLLES